MKEQIIQFIRQKDYKYIQDIGQGGTGKAILLEDETIGERFVCKKYSPIYPVHQKQFYENFKDEIKLLFLLNHGNIVRIFNYYLYPEKYTGYILMEFVSGKNVVDYLVKNPERINDIFTQTITGFVHLEALGILHRDIRPDNILVSDVGIVKIIDFGFGKKIDFDSDFEKSISLNWRYSPPGEFMQKRYDFGTELYFIGRLFEEIIIDNNIQGFKFRDQLRKMIEVDPVNRFSSFNDLNRGLISLMGVSGEISFSENEKGVYKLFADGLVEIVYSINSNAEYVSDLPGVIRGLSDICNNSILEEYVQNLATVGKCFIKGEFKFRTEVALGVEVVSKFYNFLRASSIDRQRLILNNLWQRLDAIPRSFPEIEDDDELPF